MQPVLLEDEVERRAVHPQRFAEAPDRLHPDAPLAERLRVVELATNEREHHPDDVVQADSAAVVRREQVAVPALPFDGKPDFASPLVVRVLVDLDEALCRLGVHPPRVAMSAAHHLAHDAAEPVLPRTLELRECSVRELGVEELDGGERVLLGVEELGPLLAPQLREVECVSDRHRVLQSPRTPAF
jgi:hypothetical protein